MATPNKKTAAGIWAAHDGGTAAAEFALVFPVLFVLILGIWDVGNAVMVNQKLIASSQIVIDLIGRQESVSDDELAQAFQAGTLALAPYDASGLVIEVASVEFDNDGAPGILWQEDSAGGTGDASLVDQTATLGTANEGALAVQVTYQYQPLFAGQVIGPIDMQERIFSRGRNSITVERDP